MNEKKILPEPITTATSLEMNTVPVVVAVPVPAAVPVATVVQPKDPSSYVITDKQKLGAKKLRMYAVLLIMTSILSCITPILQHVWPVDLVLSLVTASIVICSTNPDSIGRITSNQNPQCCCPFRCVYGLGIATAIIIPLFGGLRSFVWLASHAWWRWSRYNKEEFYCFSLIPGISTIFGTTFVSYISSHCAPFYEQGVFTDHDEVLGIQPVPESPPQVCCPPKLGRLTCWIATLLLTIVLIIITDRVGNNAYACYDYYYTQYNYYNYYNCY